jgi:RNase P subunit RPR2
MTRASTGSSADAGGTTPSPLKRVLANILLVSAVSSAVMTLASGLPRFSRMRRADPRTRLGLGVDRGEWQARLALEQIARILQYAARPVDRGKHLGHAYAPVAVGVEQRQRVLIELDASGRTTQGCPQFLVEFGKMTDVLARLDAHLIETAQPVKTPVVTITMGQQCHMPFSSM